MDKRTLSDELLIHAALLLLGYEHVHIFDYYAPPLPACAGTYKIDHFQTHPDGRKSWRAFIDGRNERHTVRFIYTLGELNFFHKGMCGAYLFPIDKPKIGI